MPCPLREPAGANARPSFVRNLTVSDGTRSPGRACWPAWPNRPTAVDPRKVRIGLTVISIVVLVAVVLMVVIDDPVGRAIMFGVAALAVVRRSC